MMIGMQTIVRLSFILVSSDLRSPWPTLREKLKADHLFPVHHFPPVSRLSLAVYVFPRFAVVPNHSHKAFIPYSGIFGPDSASLPHLVLHASALELKKNSVKLNRSFPSSLGLKFHEEKENFTGEDDVLEFDYCILCTGGQLAE